MNIIIFSFDAHVKKKFKSIFTIKEYYNIIVLKNLYTRIKTKFNSD